MDANGIRNGAVTCEQLIEALNSAGIRKQIPRDIVAEFKKQHTKQIVAATFGKARSEAHLPSHSFDVIYPERDALSEQRAHKRDRREQILRVAFQMDTEPNGTISYNQFSSWALSDKAVLVALQWMSEISSRLLCEQRAFDTKYPLGDMNTPVWSGPVKGSLVPELLSTGDAEDPMDFVFMP